MKRKSIFKYKSYAHFDQRKNVEDLKKYIFNKKKIKEHSFYPFILDERKFIKYNGEMHNPKSRKIMFSAHIDRYIYQLYNYKLNKRYNEFVKNNGFNNCSIAYRTNFKGKNNIFFAKQVFKFLLKHENAYIVIGDFKNYFDNLDHKHLKRMLCKLFNTTSLPDDVYAVFKNITKFSYFDLKEICKIKNIKRTDIYKLKIIVNEETGEKEVIFPLDKVMTIDEINKYKKEYIHVNREKGIPQGSSISSVLANIYMLDADKKINDLVTSNCGLYRRYCDDFIIVIPNTSKERFKKIFDETKLILQQNGNPELQDEKTNIYKYENSKIRNENKVFLNVSEKEKCKNELNFLGFTFNGKNVRIRDKAMSKFYYRMYKKIKHIAICGGINKNGNRISNRELYRIYSIYGKDIERGNFITYNEKCEKEFADMPGVFISYKNRFLRKLKNRYNKMSKKYKNVNPKTYYGKLKVKKDNNK